MVAPSVRRVGPVTAATDVAATLAGRAVAAAVRLRRGQGQAMPGLVVERVSPGYANRALAALPDGVVMVTGTNGKTTTTSFVVELLRATGRSVLTNATGSNLARGLTSSVVAQASWRGRLRHDVAVLEVDEAVAPSFAAAIGPRWMLVLNVGRDQLDRFGEVGRVVELLAEAARHTSGGVVVSADDSRLVAAGRALEAGGSTVAWFGAGEELRERFPTDDQLVAVARVAGVEPGTPDDANPAPVARPAPDVALTVSEGRRATFGISGPDGPDGTPPRTVEADLVVDGHYNHLNAAAALALVRRVVPDADDAALVAALARVGFAPGRGEAFTLADDSVVRLVLVKNPVGLHQALSAFLHPGETTMFVINDDWADGRDVSWLWDVEIEMHGGPAIAAGTRAADMALRLRHAGADVTDVEADLPAALDLVLARPGPRTVFATYTAMRALRPLIERHVGTGGTS